MIDTLVSLFPVIISACAFFLSLMTLFLMAERKEVISLSKKMEADYNLQELKFKNILTHIQTLQKENVEMFQNLKTEIEPLKQKKTGSKK